VPASDLPAAEARAATPPTAPKSATARNAIGALSAEAEPVVDQAELDALTSLVETLEAPNATVAELQGPGRRLLATTSEFLLAVAFLGVVRSGSQSNRDSSRAHLSH